MNNSELSTAAQKPRLPPRPEGSCYELIVEAGPNRGLRFMLDGTRPPRLLVGTGPACELRLNDAHISRRHVAIELGGPHLRIQDLASTNGTWVNGIRIVEVLLRGGELVQLGDTAFRALLVDNTAAAAPVSRAIRFGRVLGASAEMRRLYPILDKLAQSNVPVVIEGETGTGKELLAEAIHEASPRAKKPFIVFDCTSISPQLIESELFGHERGAFTGAVSTRRGVFEEASGGTLLIDEIGDLDLALQAKLLRALESGEIRRIGGSKWTHVDVRVVAATRRDLDAEVQAGRFRDDLFYRLAVGRVELPPLRRRVGDITLLADQFWRSLGGAADKIPFDLFDQLETYSWPGNVRELHNVIARHIALGATDVLGMLSDTGESKTVSGTPAADAAADAPSALMKEALELPFQRARELVMTDFERRYVEHLLAVHGGNVARAAAASGVARRYFQLIRARHRPPGT